MASKTRNTAAEATVTGVGSLTERITAELESYLLLRGKVNQDVNPQVWWKTHSTEFKPLSRYWRAHGAFPATSTHSERVYNIEGLVVTPSRLIVIVMLLTLTSGKIIFRKSLDPSRSGHLCACRDYLMQRQQKEAFRLCKHCQQPPGIGCSYVISCRKHNHG